MASAGAVHSSEASGEKIVAIDPNCSHAQSVKDSVVVHGRSQLSLYDRQWLKDPVIERLKRYGLDWV